MVVLLTLIAQYNTASNIMIESKAEEKRINFYSGNGFNVIFKVPDDNQAMIRKI